MKGVFVQRPTLPRYRDTWDVDVVLRYIKGLSPIRQLGLKQLTLKLVMLLALLSGKRLQFLHCLKLPNMSLTPHHCIFTVDELLKTTKPGHHEAGIKLKAYAPDRRVCIVTVLQEYVKRTGELRGEETRLLVSINKPHKAVGKSTIAKWIKLGLANAGVDVTQYTAHSIRGASVSAAHTAGCSLTEVLKAGGWRRKSTFRKYYCLPMAAKAKFQSSVLRKAD